MSYSIEKLPDEPILIVTLHKEFAFSRDSVAANMEAKAVLDQSKEPLYYVADTSAVRFNMDETVEGSNFASRGETAIFQHPNIKQVLLVVGDIMQEMTAAGMRSEAFGSVNILTFASREDALAHARNP